MQLATLFLTLGLTVATTPAQHDVVRGRVRGRDGKGWANAVVRLRSLLPGSTTETLRTNTDATGEFRIRVQSGSRYDVFAHGEPSAGRYRVTNERRVVAGQRVLLVEVGEHPLVRVKVKGLDAWKARPIRFFHADELPIGDDATLTLPPQSRPRPYVGVRDPAGVQLRVYYKLDPGPDGHCTIDLPPPSRVRLTVTQPNDTPAKGGQLDAYHGNGRRALDDDGTIELFVPVESIDAQSDKLMGLDFGVTVPGCAQIQSAQWFDHSLPKADPITLKIELQSGRSYSGRVTWQGKPVPAAKVVRWANPVLVRGGKATTGMGGRPSIVQTDADGSFVTPGTHPRFGARIGVRLTAAMLRTLRKVREAPVYPIAMIAFPDAGRAVARPVDLGEIALEKLRDVEIRVLRPDGAPARHASIVLGKTDDPGDTTYMSTDARGRIRLLTTPTDKLTVAAEYDCDVVLRKLSLTESTREIELRLEHGISVAGTVHDGSGKPVAGVSVVNFSGAVSIHGKDRLLATLGVGAFTDGRGRFRVRARAKSTASLLLRFGTPGSPGFVNHFERVAVDDSAITDLNVTLPLQAKRER